MGLSIHDLYKSILLKLNELYSQQEARAMADRLFEHYFGLTPTQRVLAGTEAADEYILSLVYESVNMLLKHVPLQYVIGYAFFMEMEFAVNQSVLIPRPETEELVGLIIKDNLKKAEDCLQILDIGTGSGCIAVSLKHYLPHFMVSAIDISKDALVLAKANAEKNDTEITFIECNILDQSKWNELPQSDIIVSNPPYVTLAEKESMRSNVVDYEPHTALFVPDNDPLLFYRNILMLAKAKLNKGGFLWFEINEAFGPDVVSLFENEIFKERELLKDMYGKYRFVKVKK